jgi:hypothetical protein
VRRERWRAAVRAPAGARALARHRRLAGVALYVPTPALGTLLGGSDIAKDLPFRYATPPVPAMCVLPPVQQRHQCADASAIAVFAHDAEDGTAKRELTLLSIHPPSVGRRTNRLLVLPVRDEADLLRGGSRLQVELGFIPGGWVRRVLPAHIQEHVVNVPGLQLRRAPVGIAGDGRLLAVADALLRCMVNLVECGPIDGRFPEVDGG